MATVSVIIPMYNRAKLACETIANMLAQSLPPHEVIVVDDGSTDGGPAIVRERFGSQIQLLEQANQGPGAARNNGLSVATGEYIQLMDSDDLTSLNKIESQLNTLIQTGADLVYSPWAKVRFRGDTLELEDQVLQQKALPSDRDCLTWFLSDWSNVFQQCLFRKDLIDRAGPFNTDLRCGEDGELFVRMMLCGAKVAFDASPITLYRADEDAAKLTGEGLAASRRQRDWTNALLQMHAQVALAAPETAAALHFRIWEATQHLSPADPTDVELIQACEVILEKASKPKLHLQSKWRRIQGMVQRRLQGHSWRRAYQPGPLLPFQKQLIEQLNYRVA